MNLANSIRYWHRRLPNQMALMMNDRKVTWGELDDRTSRLAHAMHERGIRTGDRVAILTVNAVEFCETVIACFKVGAIVVSLNYRLAPPELSEIMRRSGSRMLVGHDDLIGPLVTHELQARGVEADPWDVIVIPTSESAVPTAAHFPRFEAVIAVSAPIDPEATFPPEHPAFICYTSGTTGIPKGAVLSHRNVMAVALDRMVCDHWNSDDIGYIPYAVAFTGGLVAMWMPLYVAGAGTILDKSFNAERTFEIIAKHRVTAFIAVGSLLLAMSQSSAFDDSDLSSLKTFGCGGQPISVEMIRKFQDKGAMLAQGYGLTEGGGFNLTLSAAEAPRKVGAAGLPIPQCRAKVVRPDGSECDVDEVGELILKGPSCMERYWEDAESTAATLIDGWVHTGDLVKADNDGYITIVDRKKDMLISGGINIYPAEIERILAQFEALEELAVIAVSHPKWGEVPVVIGRARQATSEAEVIEFCRSQMARYKVPKRVVLRDQPLPRGMSGKILKRELRAEYATLEVSE